MNEDPTIAYVKKEIESYSRMVKSAYKDAAKYQEKLTHCEIILARLERLESFAVVSLPETPTPKEN